MASRPARDEMVTALAHVPLFSALEPGEIEAIAAAARHVELKRGETLFTAGEHPEGIYVVLDGLMKLSIMAPDGAERIVDLITPSHAFGEALAFLERPAPVTATALERSVLLLIPKRMVSDALKETSPLVRRMLAGLSQRLHYLLMDIESVCLHSARERVIRYVLSLREDEKANTTAVKLPARKHVIAARLNLTPETFSRVLHELAAEGLIDVEGSRIRIPDVLKLRGKCVRC
jgi:CRP-like cAMP-binding protein